MTVHNPWETSSYRTSLVNIGTHSLLALVSGQPRQFKLDMRANSPVIKSPVILIEAGGGATFSIYKGLIRALSTRYRILTYNRAGLDGSDRSPITDRPRTAVDMAADTEKLLSVAGVKPPYILLAHSYAGMQIRTWMEYHNRWNDVEGVVFLGAAEDLYRRMPLREPDYAFLFQDKRSDLPNV